MRCKRYRVIIRCVEDYFFSADFGNLALMIRMHGQRSKAFVYVDEQYTEVFWDFCSDVEERENQALIKKRVYMHPDHFASVLRIASLKRQNLAVDAKIVREFLRCFFGEYIRLVVK